MVDGQKRRTDTLPAPKPTPAVYVLAALASLGVGTIFYWLYLLADLVF